MWKHYLKITKFYQQRCKPKRVVCNKTSKQFESVHKSSKLYNWINTQTVRAILVSFLRWLHYVNTNSSKVSMTLFIWLLFLAFGYVLFPLSMFSGYIFNVAYTFSLNKSHSNLPLTLIVMLTLFDVGVAGNTAGFISLL